MQKHLWEQIQEFMQGDEVGPIMLGPDALQRTLSDQAHRLIHQIDIVHHLDINLVLNYKRQLKKHLSWTNGMETTYGEQQLRKK